MKISVTREQQNEIERIKGTVGDDGAGNTLKRYFTSSNNWGVRTPLNDMTSDQIAAAWLGIAEIEREPVKPWEAYKAYLSNKSVKVCDGDDCILVQNASDISLFNRTTILLNIRKFYIIEEEST